MPRAAQRFAPTRVARIEIGAGCCKSLTCAAMSVGKALVSIWRFIVAFVPGWEKSAANQISSGGLLISGSKVRVLVRPPHIINNLVLMADKSYDFRFAIGNILGNILQNSNSVGRTILINRVL
jgi:hypothetical protein